MLLKIIVVVNVAFDDGKFFAKYLLQLKQVNLFIA